MKRVLILTLLIVSLGISVSAQIIENGSFEDGDESNCGIATGGTLYAWRIPSGSSVYWHCGGYAAAEGGKSVELWNLSGGSSSIYQDVPTIPGVIYEVTFAMSGWDVGDPVKSLRITADGASSADFEFSDTEGNSSENMVWASRTYSFTATDASTQLMFTSTTSGTGGPFIDNVTAIARAGMVCHTNNGNGQPRTLNLTEGWAFWAHTQHGDQMGACP